MWLRAAAFAVWLPVVAYAALVSRDFFRFTDSAVYLSSDDGVANISYALATEGRYGFLSSPVLMGKARDIGLFSYGPIYFYLGSALIWLFGYSLTVLRFIHLAVVLVVAATGRAWFGAAAGGAAGAFTAIGVLMAFDRAQWPMVRPDSMVSLFAVALIVSAGQAIRTGKRRYWLAAGFAGASGAFTHLIAWSLIPAVAVILAIGLIGSARGEDGRWRMPSPLWPPLLATAVGGIAGTVVFYASFDFRFRDQWLFLTDYQQFTGSMGGVTSPSFTVLFLKHFEQAYWYLQYPLEYGVWATLMAAVLTVPALLVFDRGEHRLRTLGFVAPPVVVWLGYLLSLGTYNNFHSGYAILNQVLWAWTGGSVLVALLERLDPWPAVRTVSLGLAGGAARVGGGGGGTFLAPPPDHRARTAAAFVPIRQYSDRVVAALPARTPAWGSVEFGIEHPHRIQLVQFWDGLRIVDVVEPNARPALAPDYLVWGQVENGASTTEVLTAADRIRAGVPARDIYVGPQRLVDVFPSLRYTLVKIVAGAPYGVTRVYARTEGAPALRQPLIDVYDAAQRQWSSTTAPAVAVPMTAAPAATLQAGSNLDSPVRTAVQTRQGQLPAGNYLLRVSMAATLPPDQAAVVFASASVALREDVTDASRGVDVSPWFAGEPAVYLFYRHAGGPFYVSQFGMGEGGLSDVEASPIVTLTNYDEMRRAAQPEHAIPAREWLPALPAVTVTSEATGIARVRGDATQSGYQAYGPRIEVQPGVRMRIRLPVTVTAGRACLGVLDGADQHWLLAPDRLLPEYEFAVNDNRTVKPVLANCNASPEAGVPVQATIGDGTYATWSTTEELYVDQLMRAFRSAAPR